ncbi:Spy/CpxP family protein refolding chaperone [Taibaiella soli]|uniref:Sensor of ECF-type sigma factor n=1 Tax=Taibaiella soli TaxID=1649169 RepID=A0A2W2AKW2_9BACT|nr:Spy/CpxP family protein refolding chaperone [Taibaiella soli]PZF74212.1 hypothetical protein DN068_04125 [Taibaiella soli]
MKRLLLIILIIAGFTASNAQPQKERFERIHAAKVSYITDKLNLTSEQAARFWPVYNQYDDAIRSLRRSYFDKYGQPGQNKTLSEAESRKYIDDNLNFQEAQLNLKRKYKDEFLKVLTPQQLAQLYQAERDFKGLLLQQLKDKNETKK